MLEQPIVESFPWPLLKSGMWPLARYGDHRKTINRRPEQMYTSFVTRLEWPGEGPLFESDSNKRQGAKTGSVFESLLRPLLKSGLWPLFWPDLSSLELEVGDLNRCIFHLTQDWNGLGRGHYSS